VQILQTNRFKKAYQQPRPEGTGFVGSVRNGLYAGSIPDDTKYIAGKNALKGGVLNPLANKKLHSNQLVEVNKAINKVIKNPEIGEQKKGNLSWLRVYKFNVLGQLILIGYSIEKNKEIILTFVDIGSHENFYRNLS
jgi:mRNA-degrading endonuclease RelE of RelBE toxin-antitoxin system